MKDKYLYHLKYMLTQNAFLKELILIKVNIQ